MHARREKNNNWKYDRKKDNRSESNLDFNLILTWLLTWNINNNHQAWLFTLLILLFQFFLFTIDGLQYKFSDSKKQSRKLNQITDSSEKTKHNLMSTLSNYFYIILIFLGEKGSRWEARLIKMMKNNHWMVIVLSVKRLKRL